MVRRQGALTVHRIRVIDPESCELTVLATDYARHGLQLLAATPARLTAYDLRLTTYDLLLLTTTYYY